MVHVIDDGQQRNGLDIVEGKDHNNDSADGSTTNGARQNPFAQPWTASPQPHGCADANHKKGQDL